MSERDKERLLSKEDLAVALAVANAQGRDLNNPKVQELMGMLETGWKEAEEKGDEICEKLKQEGKFFYPNGGSVFIDYKVLRNRQPTNLRVKSVATRFRVDMTYEEIIQEAEKVIGEWQADSEKEKITLIL